MCHGCYEDDDETVQAGWIGCDRDCYVVDGFTYIAVPFFLKSPSQAKNFYAVTASKHFILIIVVFCT